MTKIIFFLMLYIFFFDFYEELIQETQAWIPSAMPWQINGFWYHISYHQLIFENWILLAIRPNKHSSKAFYFIRKASLDSRNSKFLITLFPLLLKIVQLNHHIGNNAHNDLMIKIKQLMKHDYLIHQKSMFTVWSQKIQKTSRCWEWRQSILIQWRKTLNVNIHSIYFKFIRKISEIQIAFKKIKSPQMLADNC